MASRLALIYKDLREAQFKKVPGGWLFTTSAPWFFWRWRTYRLTDAQKPALDEAVHLGSRRSFAVILVLTLLLVAAFILDPTLINLDSVRAWAVVLVFLAAMAIGLHMSTYLPVRHLVSDLPRSEQIFTRAEMFRAPAAAMSSVTSLKILTALFVFGAIGSAMNAFGQIGRGHVALGAVAAGSTLFMTLLAIAYGGTLTNRLRERRMVEGEAPTIESLATRLARAERKAGYHSAILVAFAVTFGFILAFQATDRAGSISTKGVMLRNDAGDIVAQLQTARDGAPWLNLYGHDKKLRASLGLEKGGDLVMALRDASGKTRWIAVAGDAGTRSTVLPEDTNERP